MHRLLHVSTHFCMDRFISAFNVFSGCLPISRPPVAGWHELPMNAMVVIADLAVRFRRPKHSRSPATNRIMHIQSYEPLENMTTIDLTRETDHEICDAIRASAVYWY